jgi:glycosyltransferase involved in cell wall biosynthesis
MSRAAIYVVPVSSEAIGPSVLEAALSGCALVLGDLPSLRETWAGAALFVDPDDHDALAQTVTRLIGDKTLALQLATGARSRARAFTADRMGAGYLSLYHELLVGPRAASTLGAVP